MLRASEPNTTRHADVAQLVAHNLAKVRVAGSSPVIRSTEIDISVIEVDFSTMDLSKVHGLVDYMRD